MSKFKALLRVGLAKVDKISSLTLFSKVEEVLSLASGKLDEVSSLVVLAKDDGVILTVFNVKEV